MNIQYGLRLLVFYLLLFSTTLFSNHLINNNSDTYLKNFAAKFDSSQVQQEGSELKIAYTPSHLMTILKLLGGAVLVIQGCAIMSVEHNFVKILGALVSGLGVYAIVKTVSAPAEPPKIAYIFDTTGLLHNSERVLSWKDIESVVRYDLSKFSSDTYIIGDDAFNTVSQKITHTIQFKDEYGCLVYNMLADGLEVSPDNIIALSRYFMKKAEQLG